MGYELDVLKMAEEAIANCGNNTATRYYFVDMGGKLVCCPHEELPRRYKAGPKISGKEFREGLTSKAWDKLQIELMDYLDGKDIN